IGGTIRSVNPLDDPDGDGVPNVHEFLLGLNPNAADSNNNGVPDGEEDHDEDGLTNGREATRGTNPTLVDSDDDGHNDFEEAVGGFSPIRAESHPNAQRGSLNLAGLSGAASPVNSNHILLGDNGWTIETWYLPSASDLTYSADQDVLLLGTPTVNATREISQVSYYNDPIDSANDAAWVDWLADGLDATDLILVGTPTGEVTDVIGLSFVVYVDDNDGGSPYDHVWLDNGDRRFVEADDVVLSGAPAEAAVLTDTVHSIVVDPADTPDNGSDDVVWLDAGGDVTPTGDLIALKSDSGDSLYLSLIDGRPQGSLRRGNIVLAEAGGDHIAPLVPGRWEHLAIVWAPEDNSIRLVRNGVLLIAQQNSVTSITGPVTLEIGEVGVGYMDDIRIWDGERPELAIANDLNTAIVTDSVANIAPFEPELIAQELDGATFATRNIYESAYTLLAYFQFDDGGVYANDALRSVDLDRALSAVQTNSHFAPVELSNDADGDGLPDWWVDQHELSTFPDNTTYDVGIFRQDLNVDGFVTDTDTTGWSTGVLNGAITSTVLNLNAPMVNDPGHIFRDFLAYGSIGSESARSAVMMDSGKFLALLKYIELARIPGTAPLEFDLVNSDILELYINGEEILGGATSVGTGRFTVNIAQYLEVGRNQIYAVLADVSGSTQSMLVTAPGFYTLIIPNGDPSAILQPWAPQLHTWPRANMSVAIGLVMDGTPVIVRGDDSDYDTRAVWYGRAATFLDDVTPVDRLGRTPPDPNFGFLNTDTDGFSNAYEFLSGSNPRDEDSDNDGISDPEEDTDDDGITDGQEQELGTHPLLGDTDDDGFADGVEITLGSDPTDGNSRPLATAADAYKALSLDGRGYLELPNSADYSLPSWTLEMWVRPDVDSDGVLFQRVIGTEPVLVISKGLRLNVDGTVTVYFTKADGGDEISATSLSAIARDGETWTHVAGSFDLATRTLSLIVDGELVATTTSGVPSPLSGPGPISIRAGETYEGLVDELRLWAGALTPETILGRKDDTLNLGEANLVAYFRFDDVGRFAQDSTAQTDWLEEWSSAATLYGAEIVTTIDGPVEDSVLDADEDGLPDEWEVEHFGDLSATPDGDNDLDGITNLNEYLAGLNPTLTDSDGNQIEDGEEDTDGDGIANIIEQNAGLRIDLADSDGDGLPDGKEMAFADPGAVYSGALEPLSPYVSRNLLLDGSSILLPLSERFSFLEVEEEVTGLGPQVEITAPIAGASIDDRFVTVTGTASSTSAIVALNFYVNNLLADSIPGGESFSRTIVIAANENEITVEAEDGAGLFGYASVNITSTVAEADIRVTQTWDVNGDLDTWLVDPTFRHMGWTTFGPGYPDVFNGVTTDAGQIPGSDLDIDDISGTGPENITVFSGSAEDGVYQVWSNNYSNGGDPQSTIRVLVHEGQPDERLVEFGPTTMSVTDSNGTNEEAWWHVTDISWPSGAMNPPGRAVSGSGTELVRRTNTLEGFTIEMWVRPTAALQSGALFQYANLSGLVAYSVGLNENRPYFQTMLAPGVHETLEMEHALAGDSWNHLAFTFNGVTNEIRINVNGVSVGKSITGLNITPGGVAHLNGPHNSTTLTGV
ncbi:MAG TPA: hypothetical protein DCR55_17550, partial [Lentisphaeria bacterium]|nr:hypothetical protein [Lentisphaeria bacterium]